MKLKDLLTNTGPKPLFKKEFNINKSIIIDDLNYLKDEKKNYKNNNKIFYIIRRSPGSGLFSNSIKRIPPTKSKSNPNKIKAPLLDSVRLSHNR